MPHRFDINTSLSQEPQDHIVEIAVFFICSVTKFLANEELAILDSFRKLRGSLDAYNFVMVSLMIQQLYREILSVADEQGGKLKNRVVFYCDELGTIPPIESLELIFSASRSRRLMMVPIIQSFGQLQKNYGKEGSEIIVDNCQCTIFGGFAPNSQTAEVLSKALGSRTVMSPKVSRWHSSTMNTMRFFSITSRSAFFSLPSASSLMLLIF